MTHPPIPAPTARTLAALPRAAGRPALHAGRTGWPALGVLALTLALVPVAASAQGYFIPGGQQRPAAAPAPERRPPPPRPQPRREAPVSIAPLQAQPEPSQGAAADAGPPVQLPQPPVPELPPLAKGTPPPAAVIGVLGVPDIMQASTAAQAVQKIIGERREKLNQDAQKEQGVWNSMQNALKADVAKMSPDQIRARQGELQGRERELQERITTAQRQFRDRGRIIQEATQVSIGQIERTLIAVIRQVSESRGMNLVLHRNQVALNINEFDISKQVIDQLNKVLPSVQVPPDGVDPAIPPRATAAATPAAPAAPATPAAPVASAAGRASAAASPAAGGAPAAPAH